SPESSAGAVAPLHPVRAAAAMANAATVMRRRDMRIPSWGDRRAVVHCTVLWVRDAAVRGSPSTVRSAGGDSHARVAGLRRAVAAIRRPPHASRAGVLRMSL